jgi:hypothetical protein
MFPVNKVSLKKFRIKVALYTNAVVRIIIIIKQKKIQQKLKVKTVDIKA